MCQTCPLTDTNPHSTPAALTPSELQLPVGPLKHGAITEGGGAKGGRTSVCPLDKQTD
eukprot:SAG11_NODE_92_length_17132_cov_10.277285_12_plen_58_part_00